MNGANTMTDLPEVLLEDGDVAWYAGEAAWYDGCSADANPYDIATNPELHSWWHDGWSFARNEELGAA